MGTIVYRFGLLPPTENAALVRDQIRDSHDLRNRHVEIERERRARHRGAMSAYADIRALEVAIAEATDAECAAAVAVKSARAEQRNKRDAKPLAAALKAAKERKKDLLAQWRERRAALRADEKAQREADEANEAASVARKAARSEFSQRGQRMRHGTYSMIEEAAGKASRAPLYDGIEPRDPKFRRWTGEGRIGAQLRGLTREGMLTSEWLRIDPPAMRDGAPNCAECRHPNPQGHGWTCPPRAERTNGCKRCCPVIASSRGASEFATLRLRVGTDPDMRGPVWAAWPMRMHRALSDGERVMFAAVSVRKTGPREEWSAELTVRTPDSQASAVEPGSVLAIDVGWRVMGERVRVAVWAGSDGTVGELSLSIADVEELRCADGLRSVRDKAFNDALSALVAWLREHEMPEWMRRRTVRRSEALPSQAQAQAYMAEWKSQARLASLVRAWRENRFDGDADSFGAAEAWRYHDYHLWAWEASQRAGSLRRRRDIYRCFAKQMAARYETLVLEDFDLRTVARRKPVESQETENETARSNRQMVALSELRLCLTNKFAGRAWKAPCRDTTRACNVCGVVEKFNAAEERTHTCKNGHHWDQDDNAAANLLTIWRERSSDCKLVGRARNDENGNENGQVKESPRTKAKRMAAERRARLEASRNPDGKGSE